MVRSSRPERGEIYDDMVQLCEIQTHDKCQSTENSHECPTSLLLWWCTLATSFSQATMCVTWREIGLATLQMTLTSKGVEQLKLSMKKPTWCSTVYERDFSDDPMVEVSWKGISSFSIRSDTEQQPVRLQSHETIQVQHGSASHEGAMVWYKKSRPV